MNERSKRRETRLRLGAGLQIFPSVWVKATVCRGHSKLNQGVQLVLGQRSLKKIDLQDKGRGYILHSPETIMIARTP
jgi:hypothetical protein